MRVGQKFADVKAPMLQPRASPSGCAEAFNIALGDKPYIPWLLCAAAQLPSQR